MYNDNVKLILLNEDSIVLNEQKKLTPSFNAVINCHSSNIVTCHSLSLVTHCHLSLIVTRHHEINQKQLPLSIYYH